MTHKDKELSLQEAWEARLKLRAEYNMIRAEAERLRAIWYEIAEEMSRLGNEANNFRIAADRLWQETVFKATGTYEMKWNGVNECYLATGEVFKNE